MAYIGRLMEEHADVIDDDSEEGSWGMAFKVLGIVFLLWCAAFAFGGWFWWIIALLGALGVVSVFGYKIFQMWLFRRMREAEGLLAKCLPSLYEFGNIARHFALKEDSENYDKFVNRYAQLLEVGSNDEGSRAASEKKNVVMEWAEYAKQLEDLAVTPGDVLDEIDAENIRRNFHSKDL